MNLAKFKIQSITAVDGHFEVLSNSGNTYRVSSRSRLDDMGSIYFTRHCDCPARKTCRHIEAVEAYRWDVAEPEDISLLERVD